MMFSNLVYKFFIRLSQHKQTESLLSKFNTRPVISKIRSQLPPTAKHRSKISRGSDDRRHENAAKIREIRSHSFDTILKNNIFK